MSATKIVVGTTVGVGLIWLINYLTGLKKTSEELESVTTANIHSVKLNGLTLRVDTVLKNPSAGSLKIKFPFAKILFKDKVIGTSQVIDKDITIPAHGQAKVSEIMINVPVTGLLSLGGGILNLFTKKEPAPITVKTITSIDLGWKKVPYEKSENMTLKPKA